MYKDRPFQKIWDDVTSEQRQKHHYQIASRDLKLLQNEAVLRSNNHGA